MTACGSAREGKRRFGVSLLAEGNRAEVFCAGFSKSPQPQAPALARAWAESQSPVLGSGGSSALQCCGPGTWLAPLAPAAAGLEQLRVSPCSVCPALARATPDGAGSCVRHPGPFRGDGAAVHTHFFHVKPLLLHQNIPLRWHRALLRAAALYSSLTGTGSSARAVPSPAYLCLVLGLCHCLSGGSGSRWLGLRPCCSQR